MTFSPFVGKQLEKLNTDWNKKEREKKTRGGEREGEREGWKQREMFSTAE